MLDLKKIFGSSNDRKVKAMLGRVARINVLEPKMAALSNEALRAKTDEFKARFAAGESLDDLMHEAFAVVREAAKRTIGQRHFDVQMVGGMVLHKGGIAEMKTGEGKTLVATLPLYLNALAGKGAHLITVNDYLATLHAEWMGRIYGFLGVSVGVIINGLSQGERQRAYRSDITYGTNNEFGFDYLRDNLAYDVAEMVQRGHNFAIVDEVDSILIYEARTPLIICGPTEDRSEFYRTIDTLVKELIKDPAVFEHDEKQRQVLLTEEGSEKIEEILEAAGHLEDGSAGLYDPANISVVHHVNQALRANVMYLRDRDYIVRDNEVMLIDEFTGRMMHGRRLSEGLHQAIEAKEGVEVQPENQTLASVTIQNYFRLYKKLSGMTGTAATEAQEFFDIYKMDVAEIPTNVPVIRLDEDDEDLSHRSREADGDHRPDRGLPQTWPAGAGGHPVSIEKSEVLAEALKKHRFDDQAGEDPHGRAAPGAQRPLPRAGSLHHRRGGRPRRGHHRHQHGRPRHRHPARRQHRHAPGALAGRAEGPRGSSRAWCRRVRSSARRSRPRSPASGKKRWRRAASSCSAPNATRAGGSTTSCAGARAGKATPAARNSISPARTTSCASSPAIGWTRSCAPSGSRRARRSPTGG